MKNMKAKIEEVLSRSVCGGWDRGFLESILEQLTKGRDLSVKQKQTLGKVLARNNEEAQAIHESWSETYATEYKKDALVLAAYHAHQPYYRPMSADILAHKVPERKKFLRMYDNKYSKKVLSQHDAPAKYKVGDYLLPRSNFDSHKHVEFESDMLWSSQNQTIKNFQKRGGFVLKVCGDIRSAAKGAKRYKLLPVGESTPVIVEERFLKKGQSPRYHFQIAIQGMENMPSKYSVGDFVRCYYDLFDFYSYFNEEEYIYLPFYGIITEVASDQGWYDLETVYKVYCMDGQFRFFLEDEISWP